MEKKMIAFIISIASIVVITDCGENKKTNETSEQANCDTSLFDMEVANRDSITNEYNKFYENMSFADSVLLPYIVCKKHSNYVALSIADEKKWQECIQIFDTVCNDDILRSFIGFRVVNGWTPQLKEYFTEKDVINIVENYKLELFYCGQIRLSECFDSFLFLLKASEKLYDPYSPNYNEKLFLINTFDNKITSMTNLFSESKCSDFSSFSYSIIEKKNSFRYYHEFIERDYLNPDCVDIGRLIDYGLYSFNDMGQVVDVEERAPLIKQ